MRRYVAYALLLVAVLAILAWAVSQFVQPILPPNISSGLVLFFAALLSVMGGLAAFKDIVELSKFLFSKKDVGRPPTGASPLGKAEKESQEANSSGQEDSAQQDKLATEDRRRSSPPSTMQPIPLHTLEGHIYWLLSLAFSSNGRFLISGSADCTARVWDVSSGKEVYQLGDSAGKGHPQRAGVWSVAFSPDGHTVATGEGAFGKEISSTVTLWRHGKELSHFQLHERGYVVGLAFSPDGRLLASAIKAEGVSVVNVRNGKEINRLECKLSEFAFGSDWGIAVIQEDNPKYLAIWNFVNNQRLKQIGIDVGEYISSLALSCDRRLLAAAANFDVLILDIDSGKEAHRLVENTDQVTCVAFSPNGQLIAAGCDDGTVHLYEISSSKHICQLEEDKRVTCLAFDPDGRILAVGREGPRGNRAFPSGAVQLWQIE